MIEHTTSTQSQEQQKRKKRKAPSGPGQIIRRVNTWLCRVFTGRDADGKKSYLNKTVHGTKKDAEKWVRDQLRKQDLGIKLTTQPKTTLGDHLDSWLKSTAKPRVSNTTFAGYEQQLKIVKNTVGKIRLTDLQPEHIQDLYASLSPSVARHVHAPLRSALSQAVKSNLIHTNPCDAIDLPRHKAREIQCLTSEQASRLIAVQTVTRTEPDGRIVTVENKHRVLFAFMLATGARPSECFAVRWSDIDFDRATVTIQRSVEWLNKKQGGSWYFKETKTKSSRRCVPLPASMLQQLREHRAAQNEALLKRGIRTELVFASSDGTPLQRRNLSRRYFKPALRATGLPENLSLYALRHTCATLLLQANVHPKIVAERLGHSSVTLTMDVYSHVLPTMQTEATTHLERMLYG
jgi:integrase